MIVSTTELLNTLAKKQEEYNDVYKREGFVSLEIYSDGSGQIHWISSFYASPHNEERNSVTVVLCDFYSVEGLNKWVASSR